MIEFVRCDPRVKRCSRGFIRARTIKLRSHGADNLRKEVRILLPDARRHSVRI